MVVEIRPGHTAPPNRVSRLVRSRKRRGLSAIAALGMPLVFAVGCTTARPNSVASSSPATIAVARSSAPDPLPSAIPTAIRSSLALPESGPIGAPTNPVRQVAAYAPSTEPPAAPNRQPENQLQIIPSGAQSPGPPLSAPNRPASDLPPESAVEVLPVDLPTALRLTNANNPTIALARERVEEAYAAERQADVAWLPNLQGGPEYNRHDGRDQTTQGPIITVSKQNLFINGGATLDWNTSDILFGPLVAERLVEAQSAAARATSSEIQLSAAQAYLDLLQIQGALAVNADTLFHTNQMLVASENADQAGLTKTAGDINRARTEYDVRREEQLQLEGNLGVASARLAHLLLLRPTVMLKPADVQIVPITLVPEDSNPDELVATALSNRPEIQEGRAISAAAMARLRQAKLAPLLPHVDFTYFGGEFGGGVNSQMGDFGARSDGEVDIYWQLHNLGAGDVALARARAAQFSETNFQLAEIRAQVGEEVTAAYRQVAANRRSLDSAQHAVRQAMETWRRLRLASYGMTGKGNLYDPLQPLIAERDLNQARTAYLNAVIGYNKAQFQLYWALGQPPLQAPTAARPLPVGVPVVPEAGTEEVAPAPTIPLRQ
jgi:outer membrane protein TolC